MTEIPQPVAVPQATPTAGVNSAPPVTQQHDDPALLGFHKIAAERRGRAATPAIEVPFGHTTIRVHAVMPATFAFDGQAAEVDPYAAKRMLRDTIIEADQAKFDHILTLPPDNEQGVDGVFLLAFLEQLARFYGGTPLGG
jgi:hypothetical protein